MTFEDYFARALPESVSYAQIRKYAPEHLWKSNPEMAAMYALAKSGLFDIGDYYRRYPDVEVEQVDAIAHFVRHGLYENRYFNPPLAYGAGIQGARGEASGTIPRVSVLIPVYNNAQYLRECFDSVVNQTLREIEIIIINDGSTDPEAVAIMEEYAAKDSRIRLVNKKNTGYGHSMNVGLDAARGEYIGIVESDDYVDVRMYEELYGQTREVKYDWVKSDFNRFIDEKGIRKFTKRFVDVTCCYYDQIIDVQDDINVFNFNNINCNGIYRLDFVNAKNIRFNETPGASFQDNGFWFQTMALGTNARLIRGCLLNVRRDNANSSIFRKDKVYCMCDEYKYIRNILIEKNIWDKYKYIYRRKQMHAYLFTETRISDNYKKEFRQVFAKEFYTAKYLAEIDESIYTPQEVTSLNKIIKEYKRQTIKDYNYIKSICEDDYPEELQEWFYRVTGTALNLKNPKTFNEKIQWLKIYDNSYLKTKLADKYCSRDYIKNVIGAKYLVPLIASYDKFEDINFDVLPNRFVMKANHGCGMNIIVKDKFNLNIEEVKAKFQKWLNTNYAFAYGLELQYRDIKPRITIEKYIDELSDDLHDYRFYCFGGKPYHVWVDIKSGTNEHRRTIFNMKWEKVDLKATWPPIEYDIQKPINFDKMVEIATKLSKPFKFVRVDLYNIGGKIYVGELTFTPQSGTIKWDPYYYNTIYGDHLNLSYCIDNTNKFENTYNHIASINRSSFISVIIPVYNSAKYLVNCLTSILDQSFNNTEIICVNDGSTDDSQCILDAYSSLNRKIKVIKQNNHGAGRARNVGFSYAQGDYILFVDADDYFDKYMLESMYKSIRSAGADFTICKTKFISQITNETKPCVYSIQQSLLQLSDSFNYKDIKGNIFRSIMGWAFDKLYSRNFILNNNLRFQEIRIHNDMNFVFSGLLKAEKINITPYYLINKRTDIPNQITNSKDKYWPCLFESLYELKNILKKYNLYSSQEKNYINYCAHLLLLYHQKLCKSNVINDFIKKAKEFLSDHVDFSSKPVKYFYNSNEYAKILTTIYMK